MTPTPNTPLDDLRRAVGDHANRWGHAALTHGGGAERSHAVAILAQLRRSSVEDLARDPQIWGGVVECVPIPWQGKGDEPSRAELAAYVALSMYAVHQQSQGYVVQERGRPLGRALGQLAHESSHGEAAMTRRFGALATSDGPEELAHHLRSLISLLRTARTTDDRALHARVDYGQLAADIYLLLDPATAHGVRLRWGRDFARIGPAGGRDRDTPSDDNETTPLEGASA
ncbi:MAG: type I-E CRISPR-associated protein Cse2/CasB [Nostocoides sp.]